MGGETQARRVFLKCIFRTNSNGVSAVTKSASEMQINLRFEFHTNTAFFRKQQTTRLHIAPKKIDVPFPILNVSYKISFSLISFDR